MSKFFTKPDFRKLQKEWDQKLADNGFQDIEYRHTLNGDSDFLDGVNNYYFTRKGHTKCGGDADYYAQARAYRWRLRKAPRAPQTEIRIWDLHAAGWAMTDICKVLRVGLRGVTRVVREHRATIRRAALEGEII